MLAFLLAAVPVLAMAPWTQTVHGSGRAIAFNPVLRPQVILSPIAGRVMKWYVVEGDKVKAGQRLVDLADNDPMRLERLREQELLALNRLALAEGRVDDHERRLQFITTERDVLLAEAGFRIEQTEAAILVARRELNQAKADRDREFFLLQRTEQLFNSPAGKVMSKNELEEVQRKFIRADENVPLVEAKIKLAEKQFEAARANKEATDARTSAAIETEKAALKAAQADRDLIDQQYQSIVTEVERQKNQFVVAPVDGTVFRILANAEAGGQLVAAGQQLAILVPTIKDGMTPLFPPPPAAGAAAGGPGLFLASIALTPSDYPAIVAELLISGNDLPLVRKGDRALLQFEGWPAVQFAAYPEAAAGTFEGRVFLVDPTADGNGKFRILVEPMPGAPPWPEEELLRQGVRAQGWVLVAEVRLGWEVWRLLNGFPPVRPVKDADGGGSRLGPVGGK
jgi:multidrug efflux pump subunit AcrA (membrane-fusion protein)